MDTAINGCVEMSKEIIQDKIQDNFQDNRLRQIGV